MKIIYQVFLILFSVGEGLRVDRNGVSFVHMGDMSAGYAKWQSVSAVDFQPMFDSFLVLDAHKKFLQENRGKQYLDLLHKDAINGKYLQLEAMSQVANEKKEALKIYTGVTETVSREKRAFPLIPVISAIASFAGLGAKVGTTIYKQVQDEKNNRKLRDFTNFFDVFFRDNAATIKEIESHQEDQITFNRKALNAIIDVQNNVISVESDFEAYKKKTNQEIHEQYLLDSLILAFSELISYQDRQLEALVDCVAGYAHPMFLAPAEVKRVMKDYRESATLEKSYYGDEDIRHLYNLVKVTLVKNGNQIAVLNEIRIPTQESRGRLYRIQSYPVFVSSQNIFVQIKTEKPYLAESDTHGYILFSESELNSCEHTSTMVLCSQTGTLWRDRSEVSCESSLFYEDGPESEETCNYEEIHSEKAQVETVEEGVWHIATKEIESIPVHCLNKPPENVKKVGNWFLTMSPECSSQVDTHELKNLVVDKLEDVEFVENNSTFNITNIRSIKNTTLTVYAENVHLRILHNDDILEIIENEIDTNQTLDLIDESFQYINDTLEENNQIIHDLEANSTIIEKAWEEKNNEDARTGYVLMYIGITLIALFGLMICILGYLAFGIRQTQLKINSRTDVEKPSSVDASLSSLSNDSNSSCNPIHTY